MESVKILICGDYAPIGRYASASHRDDGLMFGELAAEISNSDISCLNLEVPLVEKMTPQKKAGPVLSAKPACLNSPAAVGFNVISLANNHTMDQGAEGLIETLKACSNYGIHTVGAGMTEEQASTPLFIECKGIRVGILSFAEQEFNAAEENTPGVAILEPTKNVPTILSAREKCDALIIIIHGGNEFFQYPRPGLRAICQLYATLGASAVICHHPHIAGAYEMADGCPIHYSLGNLIFDHIHAPIGWNEGYSVSLELCRNEKGEIDIGQRIIPHRQIPEDGKISLLNGQTRDAFISNFEERNRILLDSNLWKQKWSEYCEKVSYNMLSRLAFPRRFKGAERMFRYFLLRSIFFPRGSSADKLNIIRCPSHREVIAKILEGQ